MRNLGLADIDVRMALRSAAALMPVSFIDLYREPIVADGPVEAGGWMARFRGPVATEVVAAFGTDTLPTPFLADMDFETVQDVIATLNPDAQVACRHLNTSSVEGVGVIVCGDCGVRW